MWHTWYIGIDEVGRGALAWPLVVSWVATKKIGYLKESIPAIADSKTLTILQREEVYTWILQEEMSNTIYTATTYIDAQEIDTVGIRNANKNAMEAVIRELIEGIISKEWISLSVLKICICIDGSDNFIFENTLFCWASVEYYCTIKSNTKKIPHSLTSHNHHFLLKEKIVTTIKDCEKFVNGIYIFYCIQWDAVFDIISAASILAKVSRDRFMKVISIQFPEYYFEKNVWYGTRNHIDAIINYGIKPIHRKSYEPIKTLISQTQ